MIIKSRRWTKDHGGEEDRFVVKFYEQGGEVYILYMDRRLLNRNREDVEVEFQSDCGSTLLLVIKYYEDYEMTVSVETGRILWDDLQKRGYRMWAKGNDDLLVNSNGHIPKSQAEGLDALLNAVDDITQRREVEKDKNEGFAEALEKEVEKDNRKRSFLQDKYDG